MQNQDSAFSMNGRNRQRGFTVMEMLAVALIIALMASFGGGMYLKSYKKRAMEKVARQVMMTMKYARNCAVSRHYKYKMFIDQASGRFWLSYNALNEDTGRREDVIVQNQYSRPTELTKDVSFLKVEVQSATAPLATGRQDVEDEPTNEKTIVFNPDGTTDSAVICIGSLERIYTVRLSAGSGKVRMCVGVPKETSLDSVDLDLDDI